MKIFELHIQIKNGGMIVLPDVKCDFGTVKGKFKQAAKDDKPMEFNMPDADWLINASDVAFIKHSYHIEPDKEIIEENENIGNQ
jgi:hypothetical protein